MILELLLVMSFVGLCIFWIFAYTIEFVDDDSGVRDWRLIFRIAPLMPKFLWDNMWIRKDEFHKSLDMDINLLYNLNKEGRERYLMGLSIRRDLAHKRSLERKDKKCATK